MRSKRSKACAISSEVRQKVIERDNGMCIICHSHNTQVAHYIPRSQGGLGIPENLVLLCLECHADFDNGFRRKEYGDYIRNYLSWSYDNWDVEKLKYDKWRKG